MHGLIIMYIILYVGGVKRKLKNPIGPDGRYVRLRKDSVYIYQRTTRHTMKEWYGCPSKRLNKHLIVVASEYRQACLK